NCLKGRLIAVDWACSTERHSGRVGYVLGEGQGWLGITREPGDGPERLNHRRPCPILPWRRRREIRATENARLRHPHAVPTPLMNAVWVERPRRQPMLGPEGIPLPGAGV